MSRGAIWLAAIGIITWSLSVSALALSCPAGYSQVGDVCVSSDGDVVKP